MLYIPPAGNPGERGSVTYHSLITAHYVYLIFIHSVWKEAPVSGCIVHRITLENALYYSLSVVRDVFVRLLIHSLTHTTDYAGEYYIYHESLYIRP